MNRRNFVARCCLAVGCFLAGIRSGTSSPVPLKSVSGTYSNGERWVVGPEVYIPGEPIPMREVLDAMQFLEKAQKCVGAMPPETM